MLDVRSYLNKGSYTIEALLIMSTLLVILFLLCFSFMLMYQQVILMKTASSLAQKAGREGGREQTFWAQVDLPQLLRTAKPEQVTGEIRYNEGPVIQEITVILSQDVIVPFGPLQKFFSGKDTVTLVAEERTTIIKSAEFIRNTDLFVECLERIGDKVHFAELWGRIGEVVPN